MAQDFAKKNNGSSRGRVSGSGVPGWVWLLTGAVTGAFIMFLIYLSGLSPQKLMNDKSSDQTQQTTDNNAPPTEKPTFEFYDSLKNNEIIPPGNKTTGKNTSTPSPYLLQAASFQKVKDADALKATLTLEGLDTNIQQFNNKGEIWYRVIVGPFSDQTKMSQAKATLAQHNITPIVLQKKPN